MVLHGLLVSCVFFVCSFIRLEMYESTNGWRRPRFFYGTTIEQNKCIYTRTHKARKIRYKNQTNVDFYCYFLLFLFFFLVYSWINVWQWRINGSQTERRWSSFFFLLLFFICCCFYGTKSHIYMQRWKHWGFDVDICIHTSQEWLIQA